MKLISSCSSIEWNTFFYFPFNESHYLLMIYYEKLVGHVLLFQWLLFETIILLIATKKYYIFLFMGFTQLYKFLFKMLDLLVLQQS